MISMVVFWVAVTVGVWFVVYKAIDIFSGDD